MSQLDVTSSNETTGAGVVDSWHSFASSIESIKNAHGADKAAVAVEVGVTGASAVLDTVAFALDPLAKLISAGLGWLIEHVEFLRWPLDQIAGDPDAIQALATQLHTIGQNLRNAATDFDTALKTDVTKWQGQAADQFTSAMNGHRTHIDDAGHSVDTVGYVVETTMALIAAVRSLFRDIITTVLGDIIATMLVALAAAVFTFGASIAVGVTKCVIEATVQVTSMLAKLAKVGELAGRTASRIGELTGMTRGESQAGHELTDVSATTHAPEPDPHAPPSVHPTTNPPAADDAPPTSTAPPPTAHPNSSTTTSPADHTPPTNATPPPSAHPSSSTGTSAAEDPPPASPPPNPHSSTESSGSSAEGPGGNPHANDYSDQQDILDHYHNDPAEEDDYSAQQGILDEYHNGTEDGTEDGTHTSSADEPLPEPTPAPATPTPHDESAPVNRPNNQEQPPPEEEHPPTEEEPPAPAAPKPPDPKSALKDQDISLLKKHEDWLKQNFKESQAKAKFVDNWVKRNAPDSYPLVKAMADAKSSKNWVGWVDKSAVQVDKQLTDIQQQAEAAWQQSNDQWRTQHPDPAL